MCIAKNFRRNINIYPSDVVTSISSPIGDNSSAPEIIESTPSVLKVVQHHYIDHGHDVPTSEDLDFKPVSRGGVSLPFPTKLYEMLDNVTVDNFEHIVSWQPHGRCFLVHKIKEFVDFVLPKYFQQRKYASFQRQLNLYGFNRITQGPDKGSYYHEFFLRGRKYLCHRMHRMKVKGTLARMASNPTAEPNFYTMPPIDALEDEPSASRVKDDDVLYFEGMPFHSVGVPVEGTSNVMRRISCFGPIDGYQTPDVIQAAQLVTESSDNDDDSCSAESIDGIFNDLSVFIGITRGVSSDPQLAQVLRQIVE